MINEEILNKIVDYQKSPLPFIKDMWWLTPERDKSKFIKWKNITQQQHDILLAVEKAINWDASNRISIRSWHWIWKSTTFSWLIIWYLFSFPHAQIPVTAPTADQMHDVLWKEVKKWIDKLPPHFKDFFEWTTWYIRFYRSPETWFARAKTARKESPEALAWVHWDHVMFLVDEASWVPEEIFNTAEWALTEKWVLFLMISNPTRLMSYFYDSHHSDKKNWQALHFSCLDSPMVDNSYVERIKEKHWEDSDEYRVRVLWEFPREDAVDNKWFTSLFKETDLIEIDNDDYFVNPTMWIDPAWEWDDETVWVVRDKFKAKIVAREKKSTPKWITRRTLTLMEMYNIKWEMIFVDSFWEWADVLQELMAVWVRVNWINVWKSANDPIRYLNKRAESFWRIKEWFRSWWELINDNWWRELLSIRYRAEESGKLKIMWKREMKKDWYQSPNNADALMLTFVNEIIAKSQENVFRNSPVKRAWIRRVNRLKNRSW